MMDFLPDIDIDMGRDDSPKIGRQRSNLAGIMGYDGGKLFRLHFATAGKP